MIACICNAISDQQIVALVHEKKDCSLSEIMQELGIGDNCGTCRKDVENYIQEIIANIGHKELLSA